MISRENENECLDLLPTDDAFGRGSIRRQSLSPSIRKD